MLKRDFYYDNEIADMLNVSIETIRLLCERGDFNHAEELANGRWIIPSSHFQTKKNQPEELNEKIKELERKHKQVLLDELDDFDLFDDND